MPYRNLRAVFAAALIAALAAPVLAPATLAATTAPRNLLANPGFERTTPGPDEWMPASWDTSASGVTTVFFGRDSAFVHAGRWSVNIANMSTFLPVAHYWGQELVVGREAWGKEAVLRVWTRNNGLAGRAYVAALVYRDTIGKMSKVWNVNRDESRERLNINGIDDPMMDVGWGRLQMTDARTEWVERVVRAYVPPGANYIAVRLGVLGVGQVIFDDASLTLEPARPLAPAPVGQNLLAEGDFENDCLAWELSIPPYDAGRIEPDPDVKHSGSQSMRISGAQEGLVSTRMGICQPFDGRRLAGKRVRFTAWLRGDSLITNAYLKLYATGPGGRAQSPGTELLSNTFDWTKSTLEWDIPRDAQLVWAWVIKNVPAPGILWVDDATFEVVGPSQEPLPPPKRTAGAKPGGTRR